MTLPHDILPGIKSRSDGTSRKDSRRDSKKGWRPRPVVFHHSFEAANAFGGNTPGPLGAGVASHPKTPDRLPLGPYPYRRQCDECSPRSSSADYLGPKWGRGGAFPLSTNPRPWSNKTGRRSPSRSHAPPHRPIRGMLDWDSIRLSFARPRSTPQPRCRRPRPSEPALHLKEFDTGS